MKYDQVPVSGKNTVSKEMRKIAIAQMTDSTLREALKKVKFDHTNFIDGYNTFTEEDVNTLLALFQTYLKKEVDKAFLAGIDSGLETGIEDGMATEKYLAKHPEYRPTTKTNGE